MPDPEQHPGEAGGPQLDALIAWRQQLIDSGAVSKSTFKETHLRMILRSGRTAADDIRAMLPGAVAEFADELAAVLAGTHTPAPGADTAADPDHGRHRVPNAAADPVDPGDDDAEQTALVHLGTGPTSRPAEITATAQDFAAFTFGAGPGPQAADMETITVGAAEGSAGGRPLSWPSYLPAGGGETVVIYRLVAADDSAPYAPERARLVAATTTTGSVDYEPATTAVRYYQVWVNTGASRTEALAAQPIKHADGVAVSPVTGCAIREDSGRVTGRWTAPPGVSSVFVFRIPAGGRETPAQRILAGHDNLDGFVDVDAAPGHSYTYRIRTAASVDGVLRLSEPRDTAIDITAVLTPVTDLSAEAHPSAAGVFELSWTAPTTGEVVIYRSQNGPNVGADAAELPEAALEQIGLAPDLRLNQPITRRRDRDDAERSVMSGVSWPHGWSRAYFTPVTTTSGRALLGRTFSTVRTGGIRDVDIAEYCNKQVLTFDWPEGAAAVSVFVAPKGYDPRKGLTGTSFEISAEEYDKYGGLQLPNGKLPITGCSLHLAPVAFSGGRRVTGTVRSVEYVGLLRLQYVIQVERQPDGAPSFARIYLRSQIDTTGSPAFVLINNAERIPLSPTDGQAVDAAPMDAAGQITATPSKELRWSALTTTGTQEAWAADLRGLRGWIRMFVNTPSAQRLSTIALLDPPVPTLRLGAGAL